MSINVEYVDGLSNASGMDDGIYYNAVSADQINQAVSLGTQIFGAFKKNPSQSDDAIKGACGKKPFFLAGKKKKQAYQKCVDNYLKQKNAASAPATSPSSNPTPTKTQKTYTTPAKKFLGMPQGLGITVAVLGTAAILGGGYFLIKKFAFKQ